MLLSSLVEFKDDFDEETSKQTKHNKINEASYKPAWIGRTGLESNLNKYTVLCSILGGLDAISGFPVGRLEL